MKRSSLLVSLAILPCAGLLAQETLPKPAAHPKSEVAPSATKQTETGVSTTGKHKNNTAKKKKPRAIVHYSADQHKVDSIKAAKNKMKQ